MKITLSQLLALAATANCAAVSLEARDTPLDVKLTSLGNSKVKAVVTNNGDASYNLFYKGTFLDTEAPVDKFHVSTAETKAPFTGIMQRLAYTQLSEDVFKPIMAGQSIEVEVELAELYELSSSGKYDVLAAGAIPYAQLNSTALTGSALAFSSNKLSVDVDAAETAKIESAVSKLSKRTTIQSDCSGSRLSAVRTALSNCQRLATTAASAATSGSASKFQEYFKTTSSSVRSTVAARLRAVAADCGSTSSGRTRTYCTDIYGGCSSGVLAYTLPSNNYIAYCPLFFSDLPGLSGRCRAQDQATTVLHEETHAPGVYSPGTEDNGYGYSAATSLSSYDAVLNADSYALYANAIYAGC
ncbi:neutral protease 2-like protein, partial [Aureobasidium melanogenum]